MLRWLRRPSPAPAPSPVPAEPLQVTLGDGRVLALRVTPHARARRLRLNVSDEGVRVTVPPRVARRTVEAFVAEHLDWIETHLARFGEAEVPAFRLFETPTLPLRGEQLPVHWQTGRTDKVWREHATVHLQVRGTPESPIDSPTLRRALREFYLVEASADVVRWLPALVEAIGHAPLRFHFKSMRSQWGSMSSKGIMSLDLSLVLGRPSAFRYVLVHELCHRVHHDHSPAFWREVERHFPDWRDERDWLHTHGHQLKGQLRSILVPPAKSPDS